VGTQKIKNILSNHGIDTKIVNGRLMAEELYTMDQVLLSKWIDVTGYTLKQIRNFLNY